MYTNEYDIELHQLDNKMKEIKDKLDSIIQYDNSNNPYWSARDLMKILEYKKWEKFEELIQRSIKSCIEYGYNPMDHFPPGGKMVCIGSDAIRIISDYTLSKFACKLVCMNGDPVQKPIVAMAQAYFAIAINNYEDMIDNGYYPEQFPAQENFKKLEKRINRCDIDEEPVPINRSPFIKIAKKDE